MIRKPTSTDQRSMKRPPPGISDDDWVMTPDSVRRFTTSLLKPKQPKSNFPLPTWVVLLLNLTIVVVTAIALDNKITTPCVTPYQVSTVSVAVIFLIVFHFIWRTVALVMPDKTEEIVAFPAIRIPLSILISFLNAIHPWQLTSRSLGILLLIFSLVGVFLNLSPSSPFYSSGDPFSIRGFEIQRSNLPSLEQLVPGETLTMTAGENAIVKVVLQGDTKVECTWVTAASSQDPKTGCSIQYRLLTPGKSDVLSVFVQQPACGSRQETASLFIAVEP